MSAGISIFGIVVLLLIAMPAVAGIVLIIVAHKGRGRGHAACGGCGYDVGGTVGEASRCPECGEEFTTVGILPAKSHRRPVMLGIGIAMVALSVTCLGGMFVTAFTSTQTVRVAPAPTAVTTPAPAPTAPAEPVPGPDETVEPDQPDADPDSR